MSVNGRLPLAEVRARAAAALAPADDNDPTVHANVVDAIEPPCLMVEWDEPWIEPDTFDRATIFWARMTILCLAGRVEPGPGVEVLEQLIAHVVGRLAADTYTWPLATVTAPRLFTINNVNLLGARIGYRVPATV